MKTTRTLVRIAAVFAVLALLCSCSVRPAGGDGQNTPADTAPPAVTETPEIAGPSPTPEEPAEPEETAAPEDEEPAEEQPKERQANYEFKPKVCAVYMDELYGETMREAWYDLVDAVMAGENTFACPDQFTYDWVMGQFPDRCFPVLLDVITYAYDRGNCVHDGVAEFEYLLPPEEAQARIAEFAAMIEGILNETLEDGWSDLEKALALYEYVAENWEYDWVTFAMTEETYVDYLSALRVFETKTGICQEVSVAYSYLLLQAGVEAGVMKGNREYDSQGHQWSYVRINGRDFHIDATYGMGNGWLCYFMMDDAQRYAEDSYAPEDFTITSNYAQDHPHRDYAADDDTFKPLWEGEFVEMLPEEDVIRYKVYGPREEERILEFSYAGW
ncbi:MAG: hypothetical protein J6P71_05825 [Oscillospiraceae bacterium]|nr:hypothetical protein [Oscillospiraceae bacterium]